MCYEPLPLPNPWLNHASWGSFHGSTEWLCSFNIPLYGVPVIYLMVALDGGRFQLFAITNNAMKILYVGKILGSTAGFQFVHRYCAIALQRLYNSGSCQPVSACCFPRPGVMWLSFQPVKVPLDSDTLWDRTLMTSDMDVLPPPMGRKNMSKVN